MRLESKVEKAMFQGVACDFELIFGLLANPKCDMGEIEKVMFQGLTWHTQLILGLWTTPKCDLDEVEKAIIYVVEVTS